MNTGRPPVRDACCGRLDEAFTLIELLVIAVLATMTMSVTSLVRASARTADCAGNLRQSGLAFGAYLGPSPSLQ